MVFLGVFIEGYAWIEVFFPFDCLIDIMRPWMLFLTSHHNARAGLTGILQPSLPDV